VPGAKVGKGVGERLGAGVGCRLGSMQMSVLSVKDPKQPGMTSFSFRCQQINSCSQSASASLRDTKGAKKVCE